MSIFPPPEDPYRDVPTAAVFDLFAEAANRLTGRLVHLSNHADTEVERDHWWALVMRLRNIRRSVPAHDREQLISYIKKWTKELEELGSAGRG
ncbi:hypothetical protein F9278_24025 [Streptomyces phaeolivaceus]|uniref:Uncharacterized protein n=1 Tax=Streptomyces phaeolivaceus TaxID=2653200 RepID=A0A5P8K7C5_9ACTN|nr:hypothetical protein [Streptomyces phaeolivaceus]QFQ98722.1 hypothetical protein F9278_24025 [Streptomyces phaeolivaceus]